MAITSSTKLDAALALARDGFDVFPCRPNGKLPLIRGWPEKATRNEATVVGWWRRWPDANIGLHCRDLLVVDVDTKNGGEIPEGLPHTLTVKTPSGGWHLYYSCPGGVKNGAHVLGQGVDVRSDRGFVVGAGSTVDGKPYSVIDAGASIEPAPQWAVEKAGQPHARREAQPGDFAEDQDAAVEKARQFLEGHPPAVQGQGGDAHTYATVCRVRDYGVDPTHALEALADWNETCQPPWEPNDLTTKIENAYHYAAGAAGQKGVADASEFEAVPGCQPAVDKSAEDQTGGLLRTIRDVDPEGARNQDYLVKGWLPRQSNAVMFGQWSGGKTFAALNMGLHIAAGLPWFGRRVRKAGVLYLGYEGALGIDLRMMALDAQYPGVLEGAPFAWLMINHNLQPQGQGRKLVNQALREFQDLYGSDSLGLLIIDPLRDALGGSDSDPDLTTPYLEYTREIGKQMRCSVLTIHHPGHGDKSRGRGDSGIDASMDTVIQVDKDAQHIRTLKQRDGQLSDFEYRLRPVWMGLDHDGDEVQSCVFEQLVLGDDTDISDLL